MFIGSPRFGLLEASCLLDCLGGLEMVPPPPTLVLLPWLPLALLPLLWFLWRLLSLSKYSMAMSVYVWASSCGTIALGSAFADFSDFSLFFSELFLADASFYSSAAFRASS